MRKLQRPRNHFTLPTLLQELPKTTKSLQTGNKKTQNLTKSQQKHLNIGLSACFQHFGGINPSNKKIPIHKKLSHPKYQTLIISPNSHQNSPPLFTQIKNPRPSLPDPLTQRHFHLSLHENL
ncbi:hypothetical protein O181_008867 [Austropuccinia psidii MF-1]|uniref:Uncharacterized protein n=1 Tax=Austropuccinia psidii MF-1 TaxID=1389203 RepID=A0A9Q3GJS5_9BASI|nr:hypothetical protein [Austropuccinia psidii MF-1]